MDRFDTKLRREKETAERISKRLVFAPLVRTRGTTSGFKAGP